MRFIIPNNVDQLFEDSDGSSLRYSEEAVDLDEGECADMLNDAVYQLESEDALHVVQHQAAFDQLCMCIRHIGKLTPPNKTRLIEAMASNLSDLASSADKLTNAADFRPSDEIAEDHCDAISVFVFMVSCAYSSLINDLRQDQEAAAAATGQNRGPKGRGARRQEVSVDDSSLQTAAHSMRDVARANVMRLFSSEASVQRAMSCCLKLAMANFDLPDIKRRSTLYESTIEIVALCSAKYHLHEHAAGQLMTVVRSSDNLVEVPARVAAFAEEQLASRYLAVPLIEEFCKTGPAEFSEDAKDSANIVRRQALFLTKLAEQVPRSFGQQISLLLPYLGSQAQTIRGELLGCMEHLLKYLCQTAATQALVEDGEGDARSQAAAQQRAVTKQHLYAILQERFYDKSAFIRQRVCKIWTSLVEEGSYVHVGLWKQQLPELAVERLDDKPMVVKQAVLLLAALLAHHPFRIEKDKSVHYLELERFKVMLAVAEKHLEAIEARQKPTPPVMPDAEEQGEATQIKAEVADEEDLEGMDMSDEECSSEAGAPVTPARAAPKPAEVPKTPATGGGELVFVKQSIASLTAAVEFTEVFANAMPKLKHLLTTQSADVVKEVIKLISLCKLLKVPGASEALRGMWGLVFSTEEDVRAAVVLAWKDMYLTPLAQSSGGLSYDNVAEALLEQMVDCNVGEIQAATKIMHIVAAEGELNLRLFNAVMVKIDQLHGAAVQAVAGGKVDEQELSLLRAAFMVVSMWAPAKPDWLCKANEIRLIIKAGFCDKLNDAWLARHACVVVHHLAPHLRVIGAAAETEHSKRSCKALESQLMIRMTRILVASQLPEQNWYSAAQAAIQGIFSLHLAPHKYFAKILKHMETAVKKPVVSAVARSRFWFVLSHACMALLVLIDNIAKSVKKQRSNAARRAAEDPTGQANGEGDIEDQLGAGAAAADLELDILKEQAEAQILDPNSLLGGHARYLATFLMDSYKRGALVSLHPKLRQSATLALTKLMVVDRHYCEENVPLLFSILAREDFDTVVRCNILIGLGDLNVRFPNTLEPWTEKMYEPLAGNDIEVKKTCVTVLTFLLLNDMIKVKGHIYKLALLLRDPNAEVQWLATRFWNELAKKAHQGHNPIFNLLLDIISNLSSIETLSESDFDSILSFLLDKVDKDKHVDHLKERLCMRLESIDDDHHQWHKLMSCLTSLKYTEKGTRRVMELLKHYKHTLVSPHMVTQFKKLSEKLRKNSDKKQELKQAADDYDQEVDNIMKSLCGEQEKVQVQASGEDTEGTAPHTNPEAQEQANEAPQEPETQQQTSISGNRARAKTPAASQKRVANPRATRRTKQVQIHESSDEESQDQAEAVEDSSDEDNAEAAAPDDAAQQAANRKRARSKSLQVERLSRGMRSLRLQQSRTQAGSSGANKPRPVPMMDAENAEEGEN